MSQETLNIFNQALTITFQGMAGIFIFMLIFFIIIKLIDKVFPKDRD